MSRLRHELERLRRLGPRERVREILQINTVDWRSQAELRDRVAALEGGAAPPAAIAPVPPAPAEPPADALAREVLAMHAWVAALGPRETLVSVVLPTRDRPGELARAVASVLAQRHERWELLVVDDGDGTAVQVPEDPRIRVLDGPRRGVSAARNVALAQATGAVVAYLDDDNVLLDHWLTAVAWAFEAHPEADVLYGACVRDFPGDGLPELQLYEWDRRRLARGNLADMGVLAHRAGLPEARFDEELRGGADWELLWRLTAGRAPLRLPVVAMAYTREAGGRLSDDPEVKRDYERIRARIRAAEPLRVLGVNWIFPSLTETYIREELLSLVPHGAELAFYRAEPTPEPMQIPEPVYSDLDRAVEEFRPHVLFLHWATYAVRQLPRLERLGIPFGVRVHSFDVDGDIAALQTHPLCLGVWTYPSGDFDAAAERKLSATLTTVDELPPPAAERELVLFVSAALHKRDFPLVVDALGRVAGTDRRIVLGTTLGSVEVPAEVIELCEGLEDPPLVQVNLTPDQVHALQARAAVSIYTMKPENRFGMPMAIIEALCSGCSVVVPDRPECRAYAGPNARTYRTAEDIARHCREALAGGPAIERERAENAAYGRERFCDPEIGRRFYDELTEALAARRG